MQLFEVFIIIGLFESLFITALLVSKKRRGVPDIILASFFLLFGISLFLGYIEILNQRTDFQYPGFMFTSALPLLLHGPVLWLYVRSLTEQHFRFRLTYLWHVLPLLILFSHHASFVFFLPLEEKIQMAETESFNRLFSYPVFITAIAILPIFYFISALRLLSRYRLRITTYFSDIDRIDLNWLKVLLIISLFFYGIVGTLFVSNLVYPLYSFGLLHAVGFAIASVYIVALGFFGHKQESIFKPQTTEPEPDRESRMVSEESVPESKDKVFIDKLLNYMVVSTPYLNPGLNLDDLAIELHVTAEYLSGILNRKMDTNFYDFVNQYRVKAFKDQNLPEWKDTYSIMGMAYNCGFNSKATFNRVFKKATGLTPSAYLKTGK